ncbi:baseplate J/gp47 family protein [Arthrobacter sp. H35-D1]|uniref:baseplate J/gp47 family protein n=1 Tax=Arthrobacter sp. H35-D1 TaxID=3046202 RepID=UPI0024BB19ED|nr:baseplate J/gp47 family protein [Arthrobacter sp. H35-D1]MDJ0313096.1 baseplate J/gp47 family protein [Arthrobacter sp. H35-D1]
MSIPIPNLDDRSFADLVESARERIRQIDPDWTDLSVHDPGMVLIEAFAHLTDMLMYRLNRVPEKLYAVYLNLLGTALRPPSAAETILEFTRVAAGGNEMLIPRGTQVGGAPGLPGTPQPLFVTTADGVLPANAAGVKIHAVDATFYDAVLIGTGTGRPGQTFTLPNSPAVSGPGMAIAVEVSDGSELVSGEAVLVDGAAYRYCREVEAFADARPGETAVRVDRSSGTISFAWWNGTDHDRPGVPAPGAQIRAWYRCGGGERGNVAAGNLSVLRTQISGLRVSNPEPATGGREAEPLQDALRRAPQDFQARDRAVTARDYEALAVRNGAVARSRAFTRKDAWEFANPGEVEVVLVPQIPDVSRPDGRVDAESLAAHEREDVRLEVERYLQERATIGAQPVVRWGLYKQVLVQAIVVVRPEEDPEAVRTRISRRLAQSINPLPTGLPGYGSGFGKALRVSNLFRIMEEAEPGVKYVESVRLRLDKAPDSDAAALVQAQGQPRTWFVAQNGILFRTTNSAAGWEACGEFPREVIRAVAPFPTFGPGGSGGNAHPGKVAVATSSGQGSRVYISDDLGESWRRAAELGFPLSDLAWVDRNGHAELLVVGQNGLYELGEEGTVPVQNLVDPAKPDRGFYTVDSFVDVRGRTGVVVAAEASAGIWLSPDAGAPESFYQIRDAGEDVRCMSVQYEGPTTFLWMGRSVAEGDGTGCARLKIDELGRTNFDTTLRNSWEQLSRGWGGGSCWGMNIVGDSAYAATQSGGVLRLRLGGGQPSWEQCDVNCGLPLRDRARFEPVRSVSGAIRDDGAPLVIAAGPRGVYLCGDAAPDWENCGSRVVSDVVTIPETWLFCSGDHRVEVMREHG